MADIRVAVVGATGLVGEALLDMLAERGQLFELQAVATEESAGKRVTYGTRTLKVQAVEGFDFGGVDVALFAVPPEASARHARAAAEQGCLVLDLSGVWLADPAVPVWHAAQAATDPEMFRQHRLVSVVSGASAVVADLLGALSQLAPSAVTVTSLMPASAAGRAAVEDLGRQSARLLSSQAADPELYPTQGAFNILAAGTAGLGSGALAPAQTLAAALHRLAFLPSSSVSASACWVPVFFGQSLSVSVHCDAAADAVVVNGLLEQAGFDVPPETVASPQTLTESLSSSRIRAIVAGVPAGGQGRVECWLGFDNVRCGAALRGVQMLDMLLKDHLY